jgi:transcriptional regulator with XRE-family HTH domain
MSIKEQLKTIREEKGLSRKDVAEQAGIPYTTYVKYETGEREPVLSSLVKLADYYNTTLDHLVGRAPQTDPMKLLVAQSDLSPEAQEEIYMSLPPEAQAIVLAVMRMLRENREKQAQQSRPTFWIKKHQNKAAAGFGYDLSNSDEWEEIEVVQAENAKRADFAVEIEGDSMLPDFRSGDLALIKLDPDVPVGEVGLFVLDGMGYIKERGKTCLISRNPDYPDIEGEARCIGLVIGVAETI